MWDAETQSCGTCDEKPPLSNVTGAPGVGGDTVCDNECKFQCDGASIEAVIDGDRRTHCALPTWSPTGEQCSNTGPGGIPPSQPASTDSDGDGTSDDNDTSPNNPGQGGGGGENGEGQPEDGSGNCGGDGQPACGSPGTGSGNGNTSGGGKDCSTPPSSTGDAILAQIAYQTWATRCAITGPGNAGPGTGAGQGEGNGEQPDWTKGDGPAVPTDDTDYVAETRQWGIGISTDLLDQENIFGSSSCPALPTFSIFGIEINSAGWSFWCQLVAVMRGIIMLVGAFTAIQILLGRWL